MIRFFMLKLCYFVSKKNKKECFNIESKYKNKITLNQNYIYDILAIYLELYL